MKRIDITITSEYGCEAATLDINSCQDKTKYKQGDELPYVEVLLESEEFIIIKQDDTIQKLYQNFISY